MLIKNESETVFKPSVNVRALLIIAHPDDECMFFGPAVLRLRQLGARLQVLCLSAGNYYHEGEQRRKELFDSCGVLGIPASQVTIIDNKELPDDPSVVWSTHIVSSLILKQVKESSTNLDCWTHSAVSHSQKFGAAGGIVVRAATLRRILIQILLHAIVILKKVLTFDGRGVSGHANHIAIYRGLSYLASTRTKPNGCCFLALQSVSTVRKYLSLLDLPITWLCKSDFWCITGFEEYCQAKRAMFCHRSQLLWFRYFYLLFSRYMFINTFQVITQREGNLKIQ
ncbi:N-acetylglucosaminyl-phosphatidylinositol de-N-acetylase isoform X1 [Scleropages formosus]|uniref:N-acetylglucosaminyl-phosphatidylinositol de-N-acetylase isoform X1 n=1 Tax=Scleropages formosus TaxID=113540 RepID=UPI0010FAAA40|nr:N-acetylglucosaminyl-phosphatidylinositol de-N-acetylase isoform X1 [Scleropages formosus]